jgi:hypothetical protein
MSTHTGYDESRYDGEKPFCDVVMKGGVTSGVVYPLAVVELAKKYRLQSIGGTSAGALAAAITAAAEYARASGGYQRITAIPNEIAGALLDKFQPEPHLRPLFNMLVGTLGNASAFRKTVRVIAAAVTGYPWSVLFGALPGLTIAVCGLIWWGSGWLFLGLLLAVLVAAILLTWRLLTALRRDLPAAGFGLCSGRTVPGNRMAAMTDWLSETIDRVAGLPQTNGEFGRPLTFGDLAATDARHAIELAMMTTDLSMRRPYRLPFRDKLHFFSKAQFEKLFPPRVIRQMLEHTDPLPPERNATGDLYYFPAPEHLPIVVAARMSLSFPGLIQAVPVYKQDYTFADEKDRQTPVKCWFSDGGLSSNFPIHFFDRLWPNSPTFAIALEPFTDKRHGPGDDNRVWMDTKPGEGQLLPIYEINGLANFLLTLLDAAKDWQDNLQSVLPGYRERVVRIALKDDEGGLNLNMPAQLIERLTRYGERAGELAASPDFDMDDHRWRRFLISMAAVEETLDELVTSNDGGPGGSPGFASFLRDYDFNGSYRPISGLWKKEILARAKALVALGREWREEPKIRDGWIPKPECAIRINPNE